LGCLILEDGTDRPARNVGNYEPTLRNISEERRPQLYRGGSLQSQNTNVIRPAAPSTFSSTVCRLVYNVYCRCSLLVLCINIISSTGLYNMNYVHFVGGKKRLSMLFYELVPFRLPRCCVGGSAMRFVRRSYYVVVKEMTSFVMLTDISYPTVLKLHIFICVLFRKKYLFSPLGPVRILIFFLLFSFLLSFSFFHSFSFLSRSFSFFFLSCSFLSFFLSLFLSPLTSSVCLLSVILLHLITLNKTRTRARAVRLP